ncbi:MULTISPECIES: hypothetical protein [Tenebrionibacter/Tenebrionicola group]|jgi:acetylornithine/succinyldiaminopimelate/putrescine aminotransferase|uniref:Uncharacterized protein n=2 Tax=Tenebrionibacter/Tenebrionicola group TaxID=2969848 RepID=A0A8K0V2A5_9ENTR|nr:MULTISPECIES: hypothetical protein [Tenebrionibacter/Tenebrionicola group]MBK4714231.1 hypothetical protein [Tenebrionibacter intestinalis]MBV5094268.1 hypothetical protein [Tenebrionicola larvae]
MREKRKRCCTAADEGEVALIAGAEVVRFTPSLIIVERDPDKGMARFVLERSV